MGTIPLEMSSTSLMVNAVYDFAPGRRWSPYVGGGVGVAFHNLELKGTSYTNDVTLAGVPTPGQNGIVTSDSKTSSSFAANLMAGVSVNVREGLFLDVGYKFSYLGGAGVNFDYTHTAAPADTASIIDFDDIMTHEFKVGLRYDLY